MSEPFIAEIIMFGCNFAPRGWAFCDGQLLPIAQNTALFSILGTTYGGDGRTTFGLPDLRGRVAIHDGSGTGPGLSPYRLGQKGGVEGVILTAAQMPNHHHAVAPPCNSGAQDDTDPAGKVAGEGDGDIYANAPGVNQVMRSFDSGVSGGNQSHTNIQPFNTVNYIIALQGVFPSRS